MKGIAKSKSQTGVYFVVTAFIGLSGTLAECKAYCKQHNIPAKIIGTW